MRERDKKLVSITVLFMAFAILPISCDVLCNDSCGCGPSPETKDFNILSFETRTVDANGNELDPLSFQPYDQVYKEFGIDEYEFISYESNSKIMTGIPGVAYACSPIPPKSQEKLITLEIYNTSELVLGDGTTLKVGDLLNSFFEIDSDYISEPKSIEDFFAEPVELYNYEKFRLSFTKNPEKETLITFSLHFIFENNKEITANNIVLSIM
ncbi:hypothetical protein [Algoriphagus machipongonensis]|uniref:Uncharacterized protein n=1 Tax=Algoriphagus machipongonensis TaxID=388413 RepID=A3I334_9BACT|nr:hypothetical protein [Algoriphagus machipongonensis]EAZ79233.1 hypothetical protein ALPR1_14219 [Algoriphagus machipongonensis]